MTSSPSEPTTGRFVSLQGCVCRASQKRALERLVNRQRRGAGVEGKRAPASAVTSRGWLGRQHAGKRGEQLQRHRKNDGRALVAGDVAERLEVAQLHRLRLLGEHLRRLQEL